MIHKDKFGNEIYPSVFEKMRANERVLLKEGYFESRNSPNLFYRKVSEGMLFADMRSTEEVPIWEDTRPLFYWQFNDDVPMWKRRRLIKLELENLFRAESPCRLSFYFYDNPEFEGVSAMMSDDDGVFEWPDGHCQVCGKDFSSEGDYCSKECEDKSNDERKFQGNEKSP